MPDTASISDAIKTNDVAQVNTLLQAQPALINATDADGLSPLHLAAKAGHGEIIKILLKQGADINAVTNDGCTPMELAIKAGHDAAKWFSL